MSNLHNLEKVVIKMTSESHQVTQTTHENRQTMVKKKTCFCKESFIHTSFFILGILRGSLCAPLLLHG